MYKSVVLQNIKQIKGVMKTSQKKLNAKRTDYLFQNFITESVGTRINEFVI